MSISAVQPAPSTTSDQPISGSRNLVGFDGVRALAVLAVIAAHSHAPWFHGGGLGVEVFFVLSGYLITALLLRERAKFGRIDLARFWGRRALRLLPALLAMLICVDLWTLINGHLPAKWDQGLGATPWILLYVSNWSIVGGHELGVFGPLWSLSVEEQFYLVWPLVLAAIFAVRAPRRALPGVIVAISLGAAVNRARTAQSGDMLRQFGTDVRVDMLLYGALLAILLASNHGQKVSRFTRISVWPSLLILTLVTFMGPEQGAVGERRAIQFYYQLGLPLIGFASLSLIGYLVTHQDSKLATILAIRPLSYTGRISYGMYLWHYPVLSAVTYYLGTPARLTLILATALTFLISGISYKALERPLSERLHAKLQPRSVQSSPDESPTRGRRQPDSSSQSTH